MTIFESYISQKSEKKITRKNAIVRVVSKAIEKFTVQAVQIIFLQTSGIWRSAATTFSAKISNKSNVSRDVGSYIGCPRQSLDLNFKWFCSWVKILLILNPIPHGGGGGEILPAFGLSSL